MRMTSYDAEGFLRGIPNLFTGDYARGDNEGDEQSHVVLMTDSNQTQKRIPFLLEKTSMKTVCSHWLSVIRLQKHSIRVSRKSL